MNGIYATKLGMTHYYTEEGQQIPVTVLKIESATVVQVLTKAKNGYDAVQAGFYDGKDKHINKARQGVFHKAGVNGKRLLTEFKVKDSSLKVGDTWNGSIFEGEKHIHVTAISKGHGFSGTIKKYGFSRGPATHGSKNVREPGSTGAHTYPGRVFPGKKLPGQYGNTTVTVKNLRLEKLDLEKNLMLVRGAVPGPINGKVLIKKV